MYLIADKLGNYLKITTDNKIVFTTNETLADTFNSEREATDFIRKAFPKKKRKNYKPKKCDSYIICSSPQNMIDEPSLVDNFDNCITSFNTAIDTYLTPEIEQYTEELKKYDGMILDIRHYLRDENTKLNACQGYKVMSALQKIERKRAECKKELQRVSMLRTSVKKACNESKAFEYDEYKNREIENVADFIFSQ